MNNACRVLCARHEPIEPEKAGFEDKATIPRGFSGGRQARGSRPAGGISGPLQPVILASRLQANSGAEFTDAGDVRVQEPNDGAGRSRGASMKDEGVSAGIKLSTLVFTPAFHFIHGIDSR